MIKGPVLSKSLGVFDYGKVSKPESDQPSASMPTHALEGLSESDAGR